MLLRTYHKIMAAFNNQRGYMSFEALKKEKITILQIQELEEEGVLEKFARGWYWCSQCGFSKPLDYKYIELAKVNPNSVICMSSACYLHGYLKMEPGIVTVSTAREDRRKMEPTFPIRRFYFQNVGVEGEIQTVTTEFGQYQVYSLERSLCDCFRMKDKLDEDTFLEIVSMYKKQGNQKERLLTYARALRGARCVEKI